MGWGDLEAVTSLEELVKKFLARPANSDLVVEAYPLYAPEDPGDDNGESSSGKKDVSHRLLFAWRETSDD